MYTLVEEASKYEGEMLEGVVKLKNFSRRDKRNGGYFGLGIVYARGGEELNIKVWDMDIITQIEAHEKTHGTGLYLSVGGKGNVYNDTFNLIIERVALPDQSLYNFSDYVVVRHDVKELMLRVNAVLERNVSKKGLQLVGGVLKGNLAKRFTEEFAGMYMHDAEPIGLLHHTVKMLELLELVMKQQNNFYQDVDNIDLLYIGVLWHDIGKIMELKDGSYTPISIVSHRGLGSEIIYEHKQLVVSTYGEMWYYNLLAIVQQHHGKYEERPKTIFSYIVHLIDNMDTASTIIKEKVEKSENGMNVRLDEFNLKVEKYEY